MKTKLIAAIAFVAVLASCKDDKKTDAETPEAQKPAVNEYFSVEVDAIVSKDDNFAAYFTEDGTNNFAGDKAVWNGIKGTGKSEKAIFNFPPEITPTLVRLDFGMNKEQGDVVIEKVKMDFYGKSFEFRGSDFFKYYIKSEQFVTEEDHAKGTLTIKKGANGFTTPYFYPTQLLIDSITKITTGK